MGTMTTFLLGIGGGGSACSMVLASAASLQRERESEHPLLRLPPPPTHDANCPRKPLHCGTAPKAETSEPFTAPLPPFPVFLAEEAGTTEKEPRHKQVQFHLRKDAAFGALSAPLRLVPSSNDITFLSSCIIHNMLWTEHVMSARAPQLCCRISNFLSSL